MAGLQCGSKAVRQYSRIAGRKNGSSGEKEEKQYGMALLGFRTTTRSMLQRKSLASQDYWMLKVQHEAVHLIPIHNNESTINKIYMHIIYLMNNCYI